MNLARQTRPALSVSDTCRTEAAARERIAVKPVATYPSSKPSAGCKAEFRAVSNPAAPFSVCSGSRELATLGSHKVVAFK